LDVPVPLDSANQTVTAASTRDFCAKYIRANRTFCCPVRFPESESHNQETVMEDVKEDTQEPGRSLSPPQYVPRQIPPKDFSVDARRKSPVLATLMSLMPGLGQIYIGYYQQGFINIVVIAGLISLLNYDGISDNLKPFLALFMAFYWLYNMVDAYRKSTFYNQVLAGLGTLDMPEGEQLPGARGSLAGGVVMIAAGGIALAHTRFGMPIDWIERWWPMALILMGAYLLYQSLAYQKKQRSR
jgi:hypothetical protein